MLGLRGKSRLFYTLLSWLLGRTECIKHSLGSKKKKGGVDSWKALPLQGMSNFVITFSWPSWS